MDEPARPSTAPPPGGASVTGQKEAGHSGASARPSEELAHELHVHQVELATQNEELRRAQLDLAAARDRYMDLYDFAPVGYFTLDRDGTVVEANLTGAAMVGEERRSLLSRRFLRFVAAADGDRWHHYFQDALKSSGPQPVEISLHPRAGPMFYGQVSCLRVKPGDAEPTLRIALTDITSRKQAELDRRIAVTAVEARESERRRVARQLHDELGQRLSALKMDLVNLSSAPSVAPLARQITAMMETLDDAVSAVRRIAIDLRPLMLDDLGLNASIDWLTREWAQRMGVRVSLRLDDTDPPVGERTSIAVYRMLQETLTRIGRHGRPTHVHVEMLRQAGELVLSVRSNGSGWPEAPAETTAGLRDQVHLLGGQVDVDGVSDDGYKRIAVRLPLRRANDAKGVHRAPDST
ncbi:MAG: histidine kinase [Burkholderiaceae bacterium]|nr:histidine kinase [Burkholderiaceae bacterium]